MAASPLGLIGVNAFPREMEPGRNQEQGAAQIQFLLMEELTASAHSKMSHYRTVNHVRNPSVHTAV